MILVEDGGINVLELGGRLVFCLCLLLMYDLRSIATHKERDYFWLSVHRIAALTSHLDGVMVKKHRDSEDPGTTTGAGNTSGIE